MTERTPRLDRLASLLSSQSLTVGLLLALAFLAAAGTLVPPAELRGWVEGLGPLPHAVASRLAVDDWYRSVPFRATAALFLFHLLFCALQRATRVVGYLRSGRSLPGRLPAVTVPGASPALIRERLLAHGFSPGPGGQDRFTRNGWWSLRGIVVHLAVVLVIVGGSLTGLLGSVGTAWAPEGEPVNEVQAWPDQSPLALPFSLKVARITERYPLRVRLGLLWKETGVKEAPVEMASGEIAALPGTPLTAEILRVSPDLRSADVLVREGELEVAIVRSGPDHPVSPLPFDLFLVAVRGSREPEWFGVTGILTERGSESKVSFGVNEPLTVAGRTVSLTAYRRGEGGEPWVAGLQVTSAPYLFLVALGALLLTLALLAYLVPVREARILGGAGGSRLLLRGLALRARLAAEAADLAGSDGT